jgi:hypothetical protein
MTEVLEIAVDVAGPAAGRPVVLAQLGKNLST